jgi:hypothetical protein
MCCPFHFGINRIIMRRGPVVNDLRDRFEGVAGTRVASVYCDYREQFEQTPVNLLAGLWFQLIHGATNLVTM